MKHLTDEQLSALADGALAGGARASAERHLESCAGCREALAALLATDRALSSALEHDPGEEYFESFVGRVGGRLRAAGLKGAQAREPVSRGLAEWFRSPRKLALLGAVATVVAGAGIVMLSTREVRVAALREKEIESRAAQESPPPAAPTAAAPVEAPADREAAAREAPRASSMDEAAIPARDDRAPASKAYQVRRNEAGDEVRVGGPAGLLSRPPRRSPAPPPSAPGEPAYVRKEQVAEPLEPAHRKDEPRGGARPAPAEVRAPVADKVVTQAEEKGLARDATLQAPASGAERSLAASPKLAESLRLQGGRSAEQGFLRTEAADPFAGLADRPRALARDAQRLTALAEATGVAPAWDAAADRWERVVAAVRGGPAESGARFQLARACFTAWQRAAGAKRATRAAQALDAFLASAPRGAGRDSAQAWLTRLKS